MTNDIANNCQQIRKFHCLFTSNYTVEEGQTAENEYNMLLPEQVQWCHLFYFIRETLTDIVLR